MDDNPDNPDNPNIPWVFHHFAKKKMLDHDPNSPWVPYFTKNGRALTQEERAWVAKRRGVCVLCGIKTHNISAFKRAPITSDLVYKGICIKCNPEKLPAVPEDKSTTTSWSLCSRPESFSLASDCKSIITWEELSFAKEDPRLWAISYNQLLQLRKDAQQLFGERFAKATMRDVSREILEPLGRSEGVSYAIYLNPGGLAVDAFISHCWDEPFGEFVDSIQKVFQTCLKKPNLWICALALVQGNPAVTKAQVGTEDPCIDNCAFVAALKAASKFVVVRNGTTDLYSRIWCVCELLFANKLGFVPDSTFVTGPDCFSHLRTSCLDAQATNVADKAKILKFLLDDHDSYRAIDAFVNEFRSQDAPL